jgi:RNA polymerase sigma factor (sigma-70 family)
MAVGNPYGTFENFITEWDSKLEVTIRNYKLKDDVEDIKNQIYLELFEKKYLDRFDDEKATISTWVYGFVKNSLRKRYHKNRRDLIYNGISIMDDYEEDAVGRALFLNIFVTDLQEDETMLKLAIEDIISILSKECYAAHSYSSTGIPRDMKTVATMFLEGLTPKEIAERFETSVQFVYKLIKRIGSLEELQSYRDCY